MTDNWQRIRTHLERQGLMTEQGVTAKVSARTCRTCRAPVLAAIANGRDVRADPAPLSVLGEALAQVVGRWTFALRHLSGRYELDTRDHWSIAGQPAGTRPYDVVAMHECGAAPLPSTESAFQFKEASHAQPNSPAPF